MEISGKIKDKLELKQVSPTFSTRDLIISTDEQYVQHICVQFTQDKCDLMDVYEIGEDVKVSINLRGREWVSPQGETKYFNTIQGWRIERLNSPSQAGDSAQYNPPVTNTNPKEYPQANTPNSFVDGDDSSDLPF